MKVNNRDLWGLFKVQKDFFSLINSGTNLPLLEAEEGDCTNHRLFFSQRDAVKYRDYVIHRDNCKESDLNIHPTNIDELFEENIIGSIAAYSNEIFDLPVKFSVALLMGDDIIVEDVVLDQELYLMENEYGT